MSWNKEDRSFKILINKETTDSVNKYFFNELGADTINVHADDIWAETIPYNDPSLAISLGRAEVKTLFALTEDLSVQNHQCWKANLRDWISDKYGNDFNIRLFDGSNNEIFTTDALSWFFDYQTGILTFSGALSRPTPLKVTGYRYIGIKGVSGGGGGSGGAITTGSMVVTVDYNDPTAVDAPVGTPLANQNEVDDFLTSQGATAFKHLDRLWQALPGILANPLTINLAAGVHRPSGDKVVPLWDLTRKIVPWRREVTSALTPTIISGAPPSTWVSVVGSQSSPITITGVDTGSVSRDPTITFSGTPFTGLDLKGRFLILSTGQVTPIHDNNDSQLFVLSAISPISPTWGWVGLPSTILRNSLDDVTQFGSSTILDIHGNTPNGYVSLENISVQPFGASGVHVSGGTGRYSFTRFIVDERTQYEQFGRNPNGRCFQLGGSHSLSFFYQCITTAPPGILGEDAPIYVNGRGSTVYFTDCYCRESEGIVVYDSEFYVRNSVFERLGLADGIGIDGSVIVLEGGYFTPYQLAPYGKANEIRDPGPGESGVVIYGDARMPVTDLVGSGFLTGLCLRFVDVDQSCIVLKDGAVIQNQTAIYGLRDGGGNLGVGIRIEGPHCRVDLGVNDNVSGAGGDVSINGTIKTHNEIKTLGPYVDGVGDFVRHA